ncbi:MAG TPA: hypothetical protein VF823_10730 [Anaerolineales bacterium]
MIRCDFCGLEFDPACAGQSCQGCPLVRNCGKLACPRCGYEILPEPKLFGWLRSLKIRRQKLGALNGPRSRIETFVSNKVEPAASKETIE